MTRDEIDLRYDHPDAKSGKAILCVDCTHYRPKAIKEKYSGCAVHGEVVNAMDERRHGKCGPEAKLKT